MLKKFVKKVQYHIFSGIIIVEREEEKEKKNNKKICLLFRNM